MSPPTVIVIVIVVNGQYHHAQQYQYHWQGQPTNNHNWPTSSTGHIGHRAFGDEKMQKKNDDDDVQKNDQKEQDI